MPVFDQQQRPDEIHAQQPDSVAEPQQDDISSTLTVLFEVAKWIAANSAAIGNLWAVMTNGVTNVKEWANETDQEVEVWKVDGKGRENHYRIPPRQKLNGEMWIPWADNAHQYARCHATLRVGGQPLAYLWQSGRLVRCSTQEEFVDGGVGVPGAAGAGGDRRIVFGADPQGRIGFVVSTL